MRKICVVGTGYVGLVTGSCFADLGNTVVCLDVDPVRISNLNQGKMPIYEPGLEAIVHQNAKAGRLSFTTDYASALEDVEFAFIAVGTPSGSDGEADLQFVRAAAEAIADLVDHPIVVVNKSTVPVGTGDWVADTIQRRRAGKPLEFSVVSNPEFCAKVLQSMTSCHRIAWCWVRWTGLQPTGWQSCISRYAAPS